VFEAAEMAICHCQHWTTYTAGYNINPYPSNVEYMVSLYYITYIYYNDNLHLLSTGLTLVQKGVAYSGCKIYNHLRSQIKKNSNNVALIKTTVKKFLLQYIFYSVDEYYQQNCNDYDYQ